MNKKGSEIMSEDMLENVTENMEETRQYIYILYGVSAKLLTEVEIKKEFEIYKIRYTPRNDSFDYYKELEDSFGRNINISVGSEIIAYFDNEEDAIECAKRNIGDYNDGGVNNYGLVEKVLLGVSYPHSSLDTKYWLFKFNSETSEYEEISFRTDEITKAIGKKMDSAWKWREEE